MVSRFADFLYYLTFPLILVMFPYTANAAEKGASTAPYVVRCSAVTLAVALLTAGVYFLWGDEILPLMPNGADYLDYADYMPWLMMMNAFTSCQVFYSNAEVSAGRFGFLWWLAPLHLVYIILLQLYIATGFEFTMPVLIICFGMISILRFIFSALAVLKGRVARPAAVTA